MQQTNQRFKQWNLNISIETIYSRPTTFMCLVNFCLQLLFRIVPTKKVRFKMAAAACEPDVVKLPEHFHAAESEIDEFRAFVRRLNYLTPVHKDWLCANCNVLLLRAWKASCGHHFCGECVAYVILATEFSCPRDQKTIWDSEFCRSHEVETQVSKTFVICPFGCGSAYPAYEVAKHKSSCLRSSIFEVKSGLGRTSGPWLKRYSSKEDKLKCVGNDCNDEARPSFKKVEEPQGLLGEKGSVRNKMDSENAELKEEIDFLKKELANTRIAVRKIEDGYKGAVEQLCKRVAVLEDQLGSVVANELAACMSIDKPLVSVSKSTKLSASLESTHNYGWTIRNIGKKLASVDGNFVETSENIFVDDCGLIVQAELRLDCLTARAVVGSTSDSGSGMGSGSGESDANRSWRLVTSMLFVRAVDSPLVESGQWPIKKHVLVELVSPVPKRRCSAQGTFYFQRPPMSSSKNALKLESLIDRKAFIEQILPQDFVTLQISFRDDRDKDRKRHTIGLSTNRSGGSNNNNNNTSFPF